MIGRVVQRGDGLSLYLSLVDTDTGNQIWGEDYDRKLADIVAVQKEITQDVSQKLQLRLSGADIQAPPKTTQMTLKLTSFISADVITS